ncbi:MAG TPA: prepilin-type N-terminal cleavage/methylation domain-containing protein [Gemmatimonadaceae bacterium]|jgi:prepilin-type N-terminal cleavage/methylation domain-containing protein
MRHSIESLRARRGMTLIEVMIAVVILSGVMIGLAKFGSNFEHFAATSADISIASDLATQQIELVKAYRVYSNLVATYDNATSTYTVDPVYAGFTRVTKATRCTGCPTSSNDYITVTVTVSGRSLVSPISKTTIIAAF